jgi:hypothetical protein
MPFDFDPRTGPHTPRFLFPPVEGYPYFEAAGPFDARASRYSPGNAWLLAEIALLAYAPQAFARDLFDPRRGPAPLPGFEFVPVGEQADSGCFLLRSPDCVIVAFRGTRVPGLQDPESFLRSLAPDLQDVVTDARFTPAAFAGGQVHGGMLESYQATADGLPDLIRSQPGAEGRAVWFTGHSLGGGLATLAAADFGEFQGLYTFGCPRVGDEDFGRNFDGKPYFRVVHHDDFVARLPPPVPIPIFGGLTFPPAWPPFVTYAPAPTGALVYIDGDGAVNPAVKETDLNDVFAGQINWRDVFQTALRNLTEFTRFLGGGLPTQLEDVPLPAGPVRDHAPIYYSLFLKEARRADNPPAPAGA